MRTRAVQVFCGLVGTIALMTACDAPAESPAQSPAGSRPRSAPTPPPITARPIASASPAPTLPSQQTQPAQPTQPTARPGPVTAVRPPQVAPPGSNGEDPPTLCTRVDRRSLASALGGVQDVARSGWNDAGLPAFDRCTITIAAAGTGAAWTLTAAVSVLKVGAGPPAGAMIAALPELRAARPLPLSAAGAGAVFGPTGMALPTGGRVLWLAWPPGAVPQRVTPLVAGIFAKALSGLSVSQRTGIAACFNSTSGAELLLGAPVTWRRGYHVDGAYQCVWGNAGATVAVLERIAPAARLPDAPHRQLAFGDRARFYPADNTLVFRKGPSIVTASAIYADHRAVDPGMLLSLVSPMMPLFQR